MRPLVSLFAVFVVAASAQSRYEIINLESFGSPASESVFARGINSHGQVTGSYWTPGFTELRLFKYSPAVGMVDLGLAPSRLMYATAINNAGQIAAYGLSGSTSHAYRNSSGVGYELLTPGADAEAYAINAHGQVTGWTTIDGNDHLFRYTDGIGLEDLGADAAGLAINDHGSITGIGGGNAFLYQDGVGITVLGRGEGRAINNNGVIAGNTSLSPVGGSAFIYINGSMQLLGNLGGPTETWAMNNHNEIVGQARIEDQVRAFVWNEQEGMQDLNELITPGSGWVLHGAFGINDHGQIVGDGFYNGKPSAFLLTPIPEPSTWALLALGASTMLLLRRRR